MKYKSKVLVHFDIADPAGVIFYANCFKLSHQVIEEFIQHIGIEWPQWFKNKNFDIPIRSAEAQFHGPMFAGEKFDAVLEIYKLSDHSVTFQINFTQGDTVFVAVKTTHVLFNPKKKEKVKIPEDWNDRLKNYLQHLVT